MTTTRHQRRSAGSSSSFTPNHFRTITAAALAAGQVDLLAGTSPMVLTFDDSTLSQYAERPPPPVPALRRE